MTSVRYFCTAGNGLETFLVREVKAKLAAEHVCQIPGKVLFSCSVGMDKIKKLKSAERVFLLVRQDSAVTLPAHISSAKAASILQSRLLGSWSEWSSAVTTWTRLQREVTSRGPTVNTPRIGDGRSDGQSGKQTSEGKTEREEEKEGEREREKEGERVKGKEEEKSGTCDGQKGTQTSEGKRKRDEEEEEEEREKPSKDTEEPESAAPISFRINCKCTGALSRRFDTQELSRMIGAGLSKGLGWKADLRNPQLEVNVYLSDDHCVLGIPLTRLPLANRSYIKTTGLRSTVAWAMGSLAHIKAGSLVVDPMCGVGTILLEAAQEHQEAFFLGMDIDDGQLQRANENVAFADLRDRNELLKASSLGLPLSGGSVDAVVCDLPFGRKFGSKTDMATNLPLIITEMERVLCVGGILVLLLSPQLSCLLKKLQTHQCSGASSTQEAQPQSGLQDGPSSPLSSANRETHPTNLGVGPPLTQGREPQTGVNDGQSPPLSSLKLQATHRVSLGAIDGLIHKYIKIKT